MSSFDLIEISPLQSEEIIVEYKSAMVWSDSGMMGGITSEHVTKVVQPVLNKYASDGWELHSQSICLSNVIGIHLIFSKA